MAVQALASIRELAVNWPYPVRSSSLGRWETFFWEELFSSRDSLIGRNIFVGRCLFQKLLKFEFF